MPEDISTNSKFGFSEYITFHISHDNIKFYPGLRNTCEKRSNIEIGIFSSGARDSWLIC